MSSIIKCDNCQEEIANGSPIHLSFGFGTYLDGEEYDFDTIDCLVSFCKKIEINKKPEFEELVANEIEDGEIDDQL